MLCCFRATRARWPTLWRTARIAVHHISAEDAGRIMGQVRPKLAVFSHVGELAWPGYAKVTDADVLARTRTTYTGRLATGTDLMRIRIGGEVAVLPPLPQG